MKRALFRLSAAFWLIRLSGRDPIEAWLYSKPLARDYFDRNMTARAAVEDDQSFWWAQ